MQIKILPFGVEFVSRSFDMGDEESDDEDTSLIHSFREDEPEGVFHDGLLRRSIFEEEASEGGEHA